MVSLSVINQEIHKPEEPIKNDGFFGYVYELIDPRTSYVFYVGQSTQKKVSRRLHEHIYDSRKKRNKNLEKEAFIRELLSLNLKPEIKVNSWGKTKEELDLLERKVIQEYRDLGRPITNVSPGGEYIPVLDESKRDKIIAKIKKSQKKSFEKKIRKAGFKDRNSYKAYREKKDKEYRTEWKRTRPPDYHAATQRRHQQKLKETLGEQEFKKLIAQMRRSWYASLTLEEKNAFRKRESVYRKRKRAEKKAKEQQASLT